MPNSPTIVSAALSDKELQDSINKMVANFDKGLQTMLEHSNEYVGKIQASLQKIGDTNFGAKGSNDGGIAKQTKAQNEFTDAVKKSTNEIKRQGKEGEMSFDQIAAALDKARRTVSDFNTKRASGILPSSEDYKRYEQALARIVEYNDKLKQSALGKAFGNEQAFAFDARRVVSDITAVDDRLKQLNKYYKEEEKQAQKTTAAIKENTQAKIENTSVSQPAKSARDSYIAFMQGYKQQAEQIRRLMEEERKAMQQQRQGVVDGFSKTIEERKARVKELSKEISKLYKERPDGYRDAIKQRTEEMNALKQKIRELTDAQKNLADSPIGASNRYLELEKEYNRIKNIMIDTTNVQRQSTQETERQTQSTQRYTEEIRKQAQAIRESKQWKETGTYSYQIGDATYYVSKKQGEIEAQLVRHKEQQVNYEKEYLTAGMAVEQNTKQQAATEEKLVQAEQQRLGIEQEIAKARREYISPTTTTYTAPTTDMLRKFIASKAGVEVKDVKIFDETAASASKLQGALKQVQAAYSNMSAEERNSPFGQALIRRFQELQREAQKTQQQLSRPTSLKSVMGLDEKTLDDIAYKMRQLASYRSGLNVETQTKEIEQVNKKYAQLQKNMNDIMQKNTNMIASNTALGRSWNYMKNRLAFYFTVGAGTQFIKNLIEVRSQYEMNERALGILINSAERGTQIFNELSQMALVSPYTLIELSSAAKQLTAYDVAAKDVVDTTRRLADMAAAVGIPIERLTYALGQIKAYGYLNSRDARMFANAGIPLVKQLADYYTELEGKLVSTADIYDRIKKKAIGYNDVMSVMYKMTDEGGKFFDFQAKMAGTLKVQLANLTLAWNNMLNDIGASEQGTISTGIGLLKELFLEWKNISKMVTNLAIGFGIVKAAQLAYYGVVMGTNKAIALETVLGNRLSNNLRSLASSTNAARMSSTALWVGIATFAAAAVVDILRGNEAMKEFNKTLRENAENTYNDLKKFSENYSGLRESLYKTENGKQTPVDINSEEAKKAWEVLREQIELSSHASDEYISKLLSIENVSERLRQGFAMIESIQSVSAAIKEIGDSAIKLERDWSAWWNLGLLPDGTIGNLQDAYMWLSKIEEKYGSVVNARKVASTSRTDEGFKNVFQDEAKEFVENYETELEKFRKDLQVTKQSIIDFIELKGWSGDTSKINEAFKTFTDNLILKNQLNPQQAYTLQLEMEEARSRAAKQALLQRINDEKAAYKISHDESVREALNADIERYNNWNETNGRSKVEWERFTKWLKEQHISETTAMFRNMDAEDIKSLNFQEGKHAEWVTRMVTQYAKEHKMSYDEAFTYLRSWVRNANQWSVFIPLYITTEDKKSVYDQLGEYDKAVDEADAQIERLTKRIGELNAKKKKSKEETKELADAENELTQAQKDKADAEAKGGHGKKEKKDERAANKAAKQAESELAKALKDELSTIDKVRSIYKDLTKEGMSHANAVERATRGWGETVNAINKVLQKNGLQKLDLSKFAGIENPRELVNMLQSQLNTLLKRGAKPAEIKELQTKVNTLEVDADKYDLTKITKGLNNELGKLKDEYELAVELDADPEMGNMFTEMFGLNTTDFPRTIGDYMNRVQQEFDDARKGLQLTAPLNIFKASQEQWYKWGEAVDYSKEQVDDFKKSFDGSIGVVKKWAQDTVKQTQDLRYKLSDNNGKIAIEEEKLAVLRQRLAQETNDKQKALLELQIQDQENAINKLKEEILQLLPTYQRLFGEVAEHSAWMTRKLAKDYKNMLVEGKNRGLNPDNTYSVRDPITGQIARITKERMGKEIKNADKELQKTQSTVKKITEAFKKGEDGVIDWVHGIELIGEELGKLGQFMDVVGNIVDAFGNPNEYNETAEAIHDIAASLQGVSTAAQGIGQIASGDYIGGAVSVASGLFSAISSWFDNSDKKIVAKIKDSEREVKRLENSYKNLEYAIEQAYGMAEYGARRAAVANRQLQLVELQRQLRLEQSRDSKHRDEDRILELKGQIIDLRNEISQSVDDITNDLLGISSIGDAAEQLVSSMIEAFKQGEDYMLQYDESFEKMIDNMIMKAIVSRVVGDRIEQMWNQVKAVAEQRGAGDQKRIEELTKKLSDAQDEAMNAQSSYEQSLNGGWAQFLTAERKQRLDTANKELERIKAQLAQAEKDYAKAIEPTKDDVDNMREMAAGWREDVKNEFEYWMGAFGIGFGEGSDKQLSSLQQGISGITEQQAGALEAYWNSNTQQQFLHSDLLTQIRDTMVGWDFDVQTATMGEILLQLRSSYEVQMAIHGILEGVLTPSGRAFSVELLS